MKLIQFDDVCQRLHSTNEDVLLAASITEINIFVKAPKNSAVYLVCLEGPRQKPYYEFRKNVEYLVLSATNISELLINANIFESQYKAALSKKGKEDSYSYESLEFSSELSEVLDLSASSAEFKQLAAFRANRAIPPVIHGKCIFVTFLENNTPDRRKSPIEALKSGGYTGVTPYDEFIQTGWRYPISLSDRKQKLNHDAIPDVTYDLYIEEPDLQKLEEYFSSFPPVIEDDIPLFANPAVTLATEQRLKDQSASVSMDNKEPTHTDQPLDSSSSTFAQENGDASPEGSVTENLVAEDTDTTRKDDNHPFSGEKPPSSIKHDHNYYLETIAEIQSRKDEFQMLNRILEVHLETWGAIRSLQDSTFKVVDIIKSLRKGDKNLFKDHTALTAEKILRPDYAEDLSPESKEHLFKKFEQVGFMGSRLKFLLEIAQETWLRYSEQDLQNEEVVPRSEDIIELIRTKPTNFTEKEFGYIAQILKSKKAKRPKAKSLHGSN